MPPDTGYTTKRCSPCNKDWPNIVRFTKCPMCLQFTWLTTTGEAHDVPAMTKLADSYDKFHKQEAERDKWNKEMDAVLALTDSTSLPDTVAPPPSLPEAAPRAVPFATVTLTFPAGTTDAEINGTLEAIQREGRADGTSPQVHSWEIGDA